MDDPTANKMQLDRTQETDIPGLGGKFYTLVAYSKALKIAIQMYLYCTLSVQ